jgi:hypothetical protein
MAKLEGVATDELRRAAKDRDILQDLAKRAGDIGAIATPHLGAAIEEISGIVQLAQSLVGED